MDRWASHARDESRILAGTVVSQQPGTNMVNVRVSRGGNRVLQNVMVPHGAQFFQDDLILICTAQGLTGWVALTRIQDLDSYGLESSAVQEELELHPPSNFTVVASERLLIAQWDTWAGSPVCFQVEHKASLGTTVADVLYTRGSYFIYPASGTGETRYFRVASLRYDVESYKAYYSAWTAWTSATTAVTVADSIPGGVDTEVQFNDAGVLAGASDLAWDKTNSRLTLDGILNLPLLNESPASPLRGDVWLVQESAVGTPIGLLLALTYAASGTPLTLYVYDGIANRSVALA